MTRRGRPVELIDLPLEPGAITEIHVWIGVGADGQEAMLLAELAMATGGGIHMPLQASRRDVAERLGDLAQRICQESDQLTRVELRTFRALAS